MEEKKYWESFKDKKSVDEAVWAAKDKLIDECLKIIEPKLKGFKIFDLGCGNGRLLKPLSEKYPKVSFFGIDFSAPMIEFAAKGKNIKYVKNDGITIPFDDDYFDGGYSMVMFQHITNENFAAYLKEVKRVTNGNFVFQFVEGEDQNFLSHNATLKDVKKWIKEAGLKVVSIEDGIYDVWKWVTIKK